MSALPVGCAGQVPADPQLLPAAGVGCTLGKLVAWQLHGAAWLPACSQGTQPVCLNSAPPLSHVRDAPLGAYPC